MLLCSSSLSSFLLIYSTVQTLTLCSDLILLGGRRGLLGVVKHLADELLPVHQLVKTELLQVGISANAAATWLGKDSLVGKGAKM